MPSLEQIFECHHAVWLEEAFHEQTQAKGQFKRSLIHTLKWTDPEFQLKMTHAKDSFSKNMKRKSMSEEDGTRSLVLVSAESPETNLSETSKQSNVHLEQSPVIPTIIPSSAHHSSILSTEKLELPIGPFDLSKIPSKITLTNQSGSLQEKDEKLSFPKQNENCGSMTPDLFCQNAQDSPNDQIITSSEASPTPPGSGSPQLDQLLSDLEEMKLKLSSETLCPPQNPESSDGGPKDDHISDVEDISPEDQCPTENIDTLGVSMSPVMEPGGEPYHPDQLVTEPAHFLTSIQDEVQIVTPDLRHTSETNVPSSLIFQSESLSSSQGCYELREKTFPNEENAMEPCSPGSFSNVAVKTGKPQDNLGDLHEYDSATSIQSQQELESAILSHDSRDMTEERSTQSTHHKLPQLWEPTSVEAAQDKDFLSRSISDFTPETVMSSNYFNFDELTPANVEAYLDDDRPKASGGHSEDSLTQLDPECFASQHHSFKAKAEMTSSTSDEEYSIPPGYAETCSMTTVCTSMPPEYAKVMHSGADSPIYEYSDPEPYFDCKQGASDFSETEPDEPDSNTRLTGDQSHDHFSHSRVLEKGNRRVLLSSGSEDYEDASFVHEPLYNVLEENEELLHYSEASDEEFTLCEASQQAPVHQIGAYDDTDKYLTREIIAELGEMSESSDDEFLTTRIVRRRVVIQADEMPDLPTQSVTEEKYKDENGHIVVKKVTRKIVRKCVSADGVEREQLLSEGVPERSINMSEGDGYSKMVKRTVLKSEGDHTEVTFAECEGFSASSQETAEGCKVSRVERTSVVEGERTMTHQGDPSLASDLPSAQDDFKQALGYISGFDRTELPHVVERETVREDGTVVRRAHMRKGRTLRRTVAKGTGQRKQVLLEHVDNPRRGPQARDLQQHLHKLFHRYYEEENEDNDEDDEKEE